MSRKIFAMVLYIVLFAQAVVLTHEAWGDDLDACSLPSFVVKITVEQDGDEPIYEFTVTNLYKEALYTISIGYGPKGPLRRLGSELFPNEFISPEGWEGIRGGVESPYIFYYWHIKKPEDYNKYDIETGKTLSGFRLVMSEPLDIIKLLPFHVRFNDGECTYSTVVEEK